MGEPCFFNQAGFPQSLFLRLFPKAPPGGGQGLGVIEEALNRRIPQAGALGDAFGLVPGDEVRGAVGVSVDDEGGAYFQGHPGHVAVGQAVAFPGPRLQKSAAPGPGEHPG